MDTRKLLTVTRYFAEAASITIREMPEPVREALADFGVDRSDLQRLAGFLLDMEHKAGELLAEPAKLEAVAEPDGVAS